MVSTEAALQLKRYNVGFIGSGSAIDLEKAYGEESKQDIAMIVLDNFARIIYQMKTLKALSTEMPKE